MSRASRHWLCGTATVPSPLLGPKSPHRPRAQATHGAGLAEGGPWPWLESVQDWQRAGHPALLYTASPSALALPLCPLPR